MKQQLSLRSPCGLGGHFRWIPPTSSCFPFSMYGSDVLSFATAFLTRCGFVKVHRLAPAAISSDSFVSIEDRNKNAVEDGFVRERFTKEFEEKLKACGVIPSYTNQFMQQLDCLG